MRTMNAKTGQEKVEAMYDSTDELLTSLESDVQELLGEARKKESTRLQAARVVTLLRDYLEEAQILYNGVCMKCHGINGRHTSVDCIGAGGRDVLRR